MYVCDRMRIRWMKQGGSRISGARIWGRIKSFFPNRALGETSDISEILPGTYCWQECPLPQPGVIKWILTSPPTPRLILMKGLIIGKRGGQWFNHRLSSSLLNLTRKPNPGVSRNIHFETFKICPSCIAYIYFLCMILFRAPTQFDSSKGSKRHQNLCHWKSGFYVREQLSLTYPTLLYNLFKMGKNIAL